MNSQGVQWTDDTVDNEGLGRKSSKSKQPASSPSLGDAFPPSAILRRQLMRRLSSCSPFPDDAQSAASFTGGVRSGTGATTRIATKNATALTLLATQGKTATPARLERAVRGNE